MKNTLKTNSSLNNDVIVIIRSVNERSTEACLKCVLNEVEESNVFVINEKPFSKAVQKTFELGISGNKTWTLAIDADLILMPNTISIMLNHAKKHGDSLYVYQGFILDKFKCGIRQGGPHLYYTKNLKTALELIEKDDISLRPESDTYKKMKKNGYDVVLDRKIFALHDFFQNYSDVYRKAYFHGIKHKGWKSLIPLWLEKGIKDIDYKIASIGFIEGYYSEGQIYPSISQFDLKIKDLLNNQLNIDEKESFDFDVLNKLDNYLDEYGISYDSELKIIDQKKPFMKKVKDKLFS